MLSPWLMWQVCRRRVRGDAKGVQADGGGCRPRRARNLKGAVFRALRRGRGRKDGLPVPSWAGPPVHGRPVRRENDHCRGKLFLPFFLPSFLFCDINSAKKMSQRSGVIHCFFLSCQKFIPRTILLRRKNNHCLPRYLFIFFPYFLKRFYKKRSRWARNCEKAVVWAFCQDCGGKYVLSVHGWPAQREKKTTHYRGNVFRPSFLPFLLYVSIRRKWSLHGELFYPPFLFSVHLYDTTDDQSGLAGRWSLHEVI